MSEAMKTQDLRADEENALQRRLEGIRENEMQLASTAAEIRAEMLATRRSVIKDEIIAEKDRAASDIEENLTNTSK